jgi:aminoglycoside N3'-acetyltransferase
MINAKKADLQQHLESEVGIKSEDSVFLFSDLRGLGNIEDGALGVLQVFENVLNNGNLILPTFSYSWNQKKDYGISLKNAPLMGSIAQESISRKGYMRTNHPNFSVNIYSQQKNFIENVFPKSRDSFGEGSALHNIYKNYPNCKIILLGGAFSDSIYRNTFIHTAQQISKVWYRYVKNIYNPGNIGDFVTQLVRFRDKEEFEKHARTKLPNNLEFPIKEVYDDLGQKLLRTNKLKMVDFSYSQTKVATVFDTINSFIEEYENNVNFGVQIES